LGAQIPVSAEAIASAVHTALSATEPVASALHIAAFASVLTLAYLGLGQISNARSEIERSMEAIKKSAASALSARGFTNTDGSLVTRVDLRKKGSRYTDFPVYALCKMLDHPVDVPGTWVCWLWVARQRHLPLLQFYRSRLDTVLVGLAAIYSLTVLFGTGYDTMQPSHEGCFIQPGALFGNWCGLLAASILVVILSLLARFQRQHRLERACEFLKRMSEDRETQRLAELEGEVAARKTRNSHDDHGGPVGA